MIGIAILRLGLVPVALAQGTASGARLSPDLFPLILAAFALYALARLVLSWRARASTLWPLGHALIVLAFISALAYTSGGARSPWRSGRPSVRRSQADNVADCTSTVACSGDDGVPCGINTRSFCEARSRRHARVQ